jgi:hypothetical protein
MRENVAPREQSPTLIRLPPPPGRPTHKSIFGGARPVLTSEQVSNTRALSSRLPWTVPPRKPSALGHPLPGRAGQVDGLHGCATSATAAPEAPPRWGLGTIGWSEGHIQNIIPDGPGGLKLRRGDRQRTRQVAMSVPAPFTLMAHIGPRVGEAPMRLATPRLMRGAQQLEASFAKSQVEPQRSP